MTTQSPIEPRHREAADVQYWCRSALAQAYANLEAARAENERLKARLEVVDGWSEDADGIACRDDTIKLQDARIEDMLADLAEIDGIAVRCGFNQSTRAIGQIAAIAAPYRASDPVAEALREALTGANLLTDSELAEHFAEVFAEHGLEIVERRDR